MSGGSGVNVAGVTPPGKGETGDVGTDGTNRGLDDWRARSTSCSGDKLGRA